MAQKNIIQRYILILNKLNNGSFSFLDIQKYVIYQLEKKGELIEEIKFSQKTFSRAIDSIYENFGIDIQYNKNENVYFIQNNGNLESRIIENYKMNSFLNDSESISEYLYLENRNAFMSEDLNYFLDLIKKRVQIKFIYENYYENYKYEANVEPYALKEFKNRWYLIAFSVNSKKIKTYGLERITNVRETTTIFDRNPEHNIEKMFENSFGIYGTLENPETVILSFTPEQGKYIQSLPLHHSQQLVFQSITEFQFSYLIHISFDFLQEILSLGSSIKVIEPQSLIDKIKSMHLDSLKRYE